MEAPKVVARFRDGRIARGYCFNFNAGGEAFYLADTHDRAMMREVCFVDLKAVFFVKTFEGNPIKPAVNGVQTGAMPSGRRMRVVFADGEEIIGASLSYHAENPGFFITPDDARTNNERIFVINGAVAKIEHLREERNRL